MNDINSFSLVLPDESHEAEYARVMDKWESLEEYIHPELMRRHYGSKYKVASVPYEKWLADCEDDRTTASMLNTHVPCSLHFLVSRENEIYGSIAINHALTHRGHLHAGIVPWYRGKGYGTMMLKLAMARCKGMGLQSIQIVSRKENVAAIKTILNNGGVLLEEFCEDGEWSSRFKIELT